MKKTETLVTKVDYVSLFDILRRVANNNPKNLYYETQLEMLRKLELDMLNKNEIPTENNEFMTILESVMVVIKKNNQALKKTGEHSAIDLEKID